MNSSKTFSREIMFIKKEYSFAVSQPPKIALLNPFRGGGGRKKD